MRVGEVLRDGGSLVDVVDSSVSRIRDRFVLESRKESFADEIVLQLVRCSRGEGSTRSENEERDGGRKHV